MTKPEPIRVQKYIANKGYCSRRAAEDLIRHGQVKINDKLATLGDKCVPDHDNVQVRDEMIGHGKQTMVYFAFHKPKGMQTTMKFLPGKLSLAKVHFGPIRVFPVGRLDKESSGLLLMTNDGDIAHKLMHPRFHHPKTYVVTTERKATKEDMVAFKKGIVIDGQKTAPAEIKSAGECQYEITLFEGRKRQIRYMFQALENRVLDLHRIKIGPIPLNSLPVSRIRDLTEREIMALQKLVKE